MAIKKKWLMLLGVILAVIVISVGLLQGAHDNQNNSQDNSQTGSQDVSHMYPQDAIHDNSNLAIKGIITSIGENVTGHGMMIDSYHIFRYGLGVNITEIMWAEEFINDSYGFSYENKTLNSLSKSATYIGLDGFDASNFAVGQEIECKGYYVPVTDSPYSFKLTIAPSINGSYLTIL